MARALLVVVVALALQALVLATEGVRAQEPVTGHQVKRVTGLASFHKLDPARIPPEDRFSWQPAELVAVLGQHAARHWSTVGSLAYSPDGKLLASAGADGVIRLWNPETMVERVVLKAHSGFVAIAFTSNSTLLASAGGDHAIRLWDLAGPVPRERAALKNVGCQIFSVAFSPDAMKLAGGLEDGSVRLWDLTKTDLKETAVLRGHKNAVRSVAFCPDGKMLASGSEDGTVQLWELNGNQTRKLEAPPTKSVPEKRNSVSAVAFAPQGKILAVAGGSFDNTVRLWDLSGAKPKERAVLKHRHYVFSIAFSRGGQFLASGDNDGAVRLWDLAEFKVKTEISAHPRSYTSSVAFSPEGKTLAIAGASPVIRLWDVSGPKPKERNFLRGHTHRVLSLALAPTGLLASAGEDDTVRLWELTGTEPKEIGILPIRRPNSVAFSQKSKTLLVSCSDGTLHVWKVNGDEVKPGVVLKVPQEAGELSMALSVDEKRMATSGYDATVRIWDVSGIKPKQTALLQGQGLLESVEFSPLESVVFSPDGKTLGFASFGDQTVRLWDVSGPEPREKAVLGHPHNVSSITFAPNGQTLASVGGANPVHREDPDCPVYLWDLTLRSPRARALQGHTYLVHASAFSPDGQSLVSVARNGQVILWEVVTGKKFREWVLPGPVLSVVFAWDGRHFITGNENGTAYILRLGVPAKDHSAQDLESFWAHLGGEDAGKAYEAIWTLVAAEDKAIPFLKKKLRPAPEPPNRLQGLVMDLDSPVYAIREAAARELRKLGAVAEFALQQALDRKPSLEFHRRIEALLAAARIVRPGDALQRIRAIQVLEQVGSDNARVLLQTMAAGSRSARETLHAKAALERLSESGD